MLERARETAAERGVENVEFGVGRFREPNVNAADVVVTTLALHHLEDAAKREAITSIAALDPRRVVLGEGMYFGARDPENPLFDPETIAPATVGDLVDALTDVGLAVTAVERVHDQAGVLVARR